MDSPLMMYADWLKDNQDSNYEKQTEKLMSLMDEEKFQIMAAYMREDDESNDESINKAIDYYWENYPSHPSNELAKKHIPQILKLIKEYDEQNSGNQETNEG